MRPVAVVLCLAALAPPAAAIDLTGVCFADDLLGQGGSAVPPSDAPLSQAVVFEFNGPPILGPDPASGLVVRVSDENALGQPAGEPAFGDYVVLGNAVVFRPRLPSIPLPASFGPTTPIAGDASLPGLRPDTVYRIDVLITQAAVANLTGILPTANVPVEMVTTETPPFFSNAPQAPPDPIRVFPLDGTQDLHPNLFSDPAGLFSAPSRGRRPPFHVFLDGPVLPESVSQAFFVRTVLDASGAPEDEVLGIDVVLVENGADQAEILVFPHGVLPIGHTVSLELTSALASLSGAGFPHGTERPERTLATYTVADEPFPGFGIDDVLIEDFSTDENEDLTLHLDGLQAASWDAGDSNALVASKSLVATGELGRFKPLPVPDSKVVLDTDYQPLPLPNGATPDVPPGTVVTGGVFHFSEFTLPAEVTLVGVGSNPLVITVQGDAIIEGVIDVAGRDGTSDNSFKTGFLPNPGGSAGAGVGRGGDGHPVEVPHDPGQLPFMQTPLFGGSGAGPGGVEGGGGGGGQCGCTMPWPGFATSCTSFSAIGDGSRGSGGGGGSFNVFLPDPPENPLVHVSGRRGAIGMGNHLPIPFDLTQPIPPPPAAYEGGPNAVARPNPNPTFAEAYLQGAIYDKGPQMDVANSTWAQTTRVLLFGNAGPPAFQDADPENNFIGPQGELTSVRGGQGGGAGGSRTEGLDVQCIPFITSMGLPPTTLDARGGGGGGGGGALLLRASGQIVLRGDKARIEAMGGAGGGGEHIGSSTRGGAGGGGSGGCIVLQAQGGVVMNDPALPGVAIDVSAGPGRCAATISSSSSTGIPGGDAQTLQVADGGPGGPGLVQIHTSDPSLVDTSRIRASISSSVFDIAPFNMTEMNPLVPMEKTPLPFTSVSVGRSTWFDLGSVARPFRPKLVTTAGKLAVPIFGVPGFSPFFKGTDPETGEVITDAAGFVIDPDENDIEVDAPDLGIDDFIPKGPVHFQSVGVRFQGANGDPAHPGCPDLASATEWTSDIRDLNGKPFIRFEVRFDIATNPTFPVSEATPRPRVNFLRIPFRF